MEGKLLLLGLLRGSDMYGYQINEVIDTHLRTSVHLTRPTAYRLLNQMADDGWVTFHEEQEGSRPTRRVFSITPEGERAFQENLRACLAAYTPEEYQSITCVGFLDEIEAHEAVPLLKERREKIIRLLESQTKYDSHGTGSMQYIIDHHGRHLQTDLEWLQGVIDQVKEKEML